MVVMNEYAVRTRWNRTSDSLSRFVRVKKFTITLHYVTVLMFITSNIVNAWCVRSCLSCHVVLTVYCHYEYERSLT